jgi:Protein phosphatase 2C
MSENFRLEAAVEFAENPEPRCPCVLLLDTATTLIVSVACPDFVAMAQIGDGAVVVGDHSGQITSLSAQTTI